MAWFSWTERTVYFKLRRSFFWSFFCKQTKGNILYVASDAVPLAVKGLAFKVVHIKWILVWPHLLQSGLGLCWTWRRGMRRLEQGGKSINRLFHLQRYICVSVCACYLERGWGVVKRTEVLTVQIQKTYITALDFKIAPSYFITGLQ